MCRKAGNPARLQQPALNWHARRTGSIWLLPMTLRRTHAPFWLAKLYRSRGLRKGNPAAVFRKVEVAGA